MSDRMDVSWPKPESLTDFLLARLDEDAVRATMRAWHDERCDYIPRPGSDYTYPCDCGVPERMMRDVEAKRAIVEQYESGRTLMMAPVDDAQIMAHRAAIEAEERIAMIMATVYADHPDYREEWRS